MYFCLCVCNYSMMGFDDDERGIIPRFCEDLFTRIANVEMQQVFLQYVHLNNLFPTSTSKRKSLEVHCCCCCYSSDTYRICSQTVLSTADH